MTRTLISTLGAALIGCGCAAVGPDYVRPETGLPPSYGALGSGTARSTLMQAQWWRLYADPRLDALVDSALERNADIRIAVARIEETDANLREAGAAFLPQVDLGATPQHQRISRAAATPVPSSVPVVRNDIRLTLGTSFELDFWGKLRRALEATRALALGSRSASEVVRLTLTGLTAQTYFALRSLDAQITLTRSTLQLRDEFVEVVRSRVQGGIASELDLTQALLARADASVQLKELQRQRAVIEHQLALLSGKADLKMPEGDLLILPVPPQPPAGLPSELLQRRPDIVQAEQQLVAANAQIGIARAAMFPTIALTAYAGGQSSALSTVLTSGASIWSLGFGLSLPVFDAGRYEARAQAAEARHRQAIGGYQKAVEAAFREVADALTNAQQTDAVEMDLQTRVETARRALHLARLRYEAGYSAYLEMLEAQRAANDAELAFLRNRQARLAASVDLMKALGGGWSADAMSIARVAPSGTGMK